MLESERGWDVRTDGVRGAFVQAALVAGGLEARAGHDQIGDLWNEAVCAHPSLSLGSDCAWQKPCLCLRCTRRSPGLVSRKCEQLKTLCPGWVVAVDTLGAPQGCQALVELWMSSQGDVAVCVLCVSQQCWAGWVGGR